jgi:hypothetical protein
MLAGVKQERYEELLQTELKFNTDYYRIVDFTKLEFELAEEESKDHVVDLNSMPQRTRSGTQRMISFPVVES